MTKRRKAASIEPTTARSTTMRTALTGSNAKTMNKPTVTEVIGIGLNSDYCRTKTLRSRFIALILLAFSIQVGYCGATSKYDNDGGSNYAAPFAASEHDKGPNMAAEGYGRSSADRALSGASKSVLSSAASAAPAAANTIVPFSQYEKHLRRYVAGEDVTTALPRLLGRSRASAAANLATPGSEPSLTPSFRQESHGGAGEPAGGQLVGEDEEDPLTPRILYLPPQRNATAAMSAGPPPDPNDGAHRAWNPIRPQTHRNGTSHGEDRRPVYSTSSSREPLPFQKSVFRSKFAPSSSVDAEKSPASSRAVGRLASSYAPIGASAEESRGTPLDGMFRPSPALSSRPPQQISSRYSAVDASDPTLGRPDGGGARHLGGYESGPPPYTRHIAPAPSAKLSAGASQSNIVDSIFSQSQVRHAPQTLGAAITPVQSFGPPLSGSPFDLLGGGGTGAGGNAAANGLSSLMAGLTGGGGGSGGVGAMPAGAAANPLANFNPLQLLGQGGPALEQISRIAKNLLSSAASSGGSGGGGGGGNGELLSALGKAISGGGAADASKLTSTAVSQPVSESAANAVAAGVKNIGALIDDANATSTDENLVFNRTNATAAGDNSNSTIDGSMSLLKELPPEQRKLLEAAIRNGELDVSTLSPSLNALLNKGNATTGGGLGGLIHSENKLMEWIQQNRPRTAEKEARQNSLIISAADRLPYYGRYCGSFVEQQTTPQHYGVGGAVWAASNRELIVSKFNFRPASRTENITFWAGPAQATGTAADVLPSANGFYLRPMPVDIKAFAVHDTTKLPAKIRKPGDKPVARDSPAAAAEAEEEHTEPTTSSNTSIPLASTVPPTQTSSSTSLTAVTTGSAVPAKKSPDNEQKDVRRAKRNLYDELYRTASPPHYSSFMPPPPSTSIYAPSAFYYPSTGNSAATTARSIHFTIQPSSLFASTLASSDVTENMAVAPQSTTVMSLYGPPTPIQSQQQQQSQASGAKFVITAASSPAPPTSSFSGTVSADHGEFSALDWYAGFQPLVLTLPAGRHVTDLHWVSLFDHNAKKAIAYVLIPDGPGFQVPAMVQLRPLSANAGFELRSGSIKVLDTKTIEVSDFYFASRGVPSWFMVGKDILPNSSGNIVPLYNRTTKAFDCDSLRDYNGETVTLRLPGSLEVRDVFWFSVFSIPRGASLAHLHLPYNEIHAPPDLDATPTPQCIWNDKDA